MATLPSRWHCMQTASRLGAESFAGLTIAAVPAAAWAAPGPWQRSQVIPSWANSGTSYLFSVPGRGLRALLVWQLKHSGNAGRVIGICVEDWKAGAVSQTFF